MSFDRNFFIKPNQVKININFSLFNKSPTKQYEDINEENERNLLQVPAALWLYIYNFLDAPPLIALTITCKTFSIISKDPSVKKKIDCAHKNKKSLETKKSLFAQIATEKEPFLPNLLAYSASPSYERLVKIQEASIVHNDKPGQEFCMKKTL
ncbi:MAG: hypothetical protein K0S27_335 [Gammaproteobacteria bacterium]|jgi:hypothetical protein|nr:hypothetical protein [Gammaproteobacteria bacterium]